jgi:hypothetical protein
VVFELNDLLASGNAGGDHKQRHGTHGGGSAHNALIISNQTGQTSSI